MWQRCDSTKRMARRRHCLTQPTSNRLSHPMGVGAADDARTAHIRPSTRDKLK